MLMLRANGVNLSYEVTGSGAPLLWVHEFGGDLRSWEPHVRHFSRRYSVVTYNQRGYAPSSIPRAASDYTQQVLIEDLHELIKHLGIAPVHVGAVPWVPMWRATSPLGTRK